MKVILCPEVHDDEEGPQRLENYALGLLSEYKPEEIILCSENSSDEFRKFVFSKMPKLNQADLAMLRGNTRWRWASGSLRDTINSVQNEFLKVFMALSERGIMTFPVDIDDSSESGVNLKLIRWEIEDSWGKLNKANNFEDAISLFVDHWRTLEHNVDFRNPQIFSNILGAISKAKPKCVVITYGRGHLDYLKARFEEIGFDIIVLENPHEKIWNIYKEAESAITRNDPTSENDRVSIAKAMLLMITTRVEDRSLDYAVTKIIDIRAVQDARALFDEIVFGRLVAPETKPKNRAQERIRQLRSRGAI